jgi:A/G-specific adenine glycosylase
LTSVISNRQLRDFRRRLLRWYAKHGRDLPWRQTRDPYAILISEVMLQQTQVTTVRAYYDRWLNRFPNFSALAHALENDVLHAWQGLGYYRRARNLHAAAKIIVSQHNGILPRSPEVLRRLPGMGRYTTNAVATFAFNQAVPIVETNITRVVARLFDIKIPVDSVAGREQLWQTAELLVPRTNPARFNSALMDLGALVCRGTPQCDACPVQDFCRASDPRSLPVKKPAPDLKRLTESHSLTVHQRRILLEQCTHRWSGMWMLPPFRRAGRVKPAIHSSVFPFTHHRITLRVFQDNKIRGRSHRQRWVPIDQLHRMPIPSPHRRAIDACLSFDVCQSSSDR